MGLTDKQLEVLRWDGPTPDPVTRGPLVLGPNLVADPPVILAPMAAVTNPPFRMICRELGAGLVVTEMIYSVGLVHRDKRSMKMLDIRDDEHPVSVQIYGKDPQMLAHAAAIVEEAGADSVDLNMGCPMRKVVSSGHGAALLRDPSKVFEIFDAMVKAVDIPVTGKIRAGWEDTNAVDVARAMEDAGAAAVTIHGRTRCAMYDGHADLAVIRDLKQSVGELKVIGNGDVCDWVSARRMFSITGCDAVMVARGCLGNPWVFEQIKADLAGEAIPEPPSAEEKARVLRRHVDLYVDTFGEELTTRQNRKHLIWYFRGTPGEKELRSRLKDIQKRSDIDDAIEAACELHDADYSNVA